jgi:hypothetical protein
MRQGAGNGTESYWYGIPPEPKQNSSQQVQSLFVENGDCSASSL